MKLLWRSPLYFAITSIGLTLSGTAGDWPGWRGPSRQGLSLEPNLPLTWSDTEHVKWKSPVPGEGWSSPIVAGGMVYLTSTEEQGKSCRVLCYDAVTGVLKWNKEVFRQTTGRKETRNSYASPTPVTDGKLIYAVFGGGGIAAVDLAGEVVWTFTEFHFYSRHGLGASPVLEAGLLVMPWDSSADPEKEGAASEKLGWQMPWDRSFVFALDSASGKLVWKTGRGLSRIAHVTPNLWKDGTGRTQVVSAAGDVLQGFDLKTGERLWSALNEGEGVAPSVILAGDVAVQANGWGGFDSVRAYRLTGATGVVPESALVWEQKKNAPKVPSMIYVEPHIFCVTEGGMAWCAKADTGELLYRERVGGTFSASPVAAAERVYFTGDRGETLVLATSGKFELLATNRLSEEIQASPAVADGCFFFRTTKSLICIGK